MSRALLIGREPGSDLGFSYTAEPPYDAVLTPLAKEILEGND